MGDLQDSKKVRMEALYKGHVQGVGFRFTTQRMARQFHVTGYVKNLADGSVQLIAEGDRLELQAFLKTIRDSVLKDYIQDFKVDWLESQNQFTSFSIAT